MPPRYAVILDAHRIQEVFLCQWLWMIHPPFETAGAVLYSSIFLSIRRERPRTCACDHCPLTIAEEEDHRSGSEARTAG